MADAAGGIVTRREPGVVAHRGFAGAYPENTLPAIEAALRAGIMHVEFDVQLSADGVAVVLHDTNLKRTAGVDASALDLTAAQLSRIEVNETARFGNRFHGVRLPLLTDALELISTQPQSHAFVEVKRESIIASGLHATTSRIVRDIEESGTAAQCTLISFDHLALELARELGLGSVGWVLPAYDENTHRIATRLAPQFVFCDYRLLPAAPAQVWHGPWQWAVYEVTTRTMAQGLALQGVHLIETMQIDAFLDATGRAN